MSFHVITQAPARLNRSELAVPGSAPQMFEKAAQSDADVIFLDLEDAVAPDDKAQARKNIIKALNEMDWGKKTMSVRSMDSIPTTCTATWWMWWNRQASVLI